MVPPYYDSLLAKVVAHASTREGALARIDAALRETRISGVKTTVDICRRIVQDERFRAGGVSIEFLPSLLAEPAALVPS
jgi:biotin carboxylase